MDVEQADVKKLKLLNVIGFNGGIASGFIVHPNEQHVVYALGCTVVVEDLLTRKQDILHGHSNNVCCLTVSHCGKYIASGQSTHMGYKADIIVWDFASRNQYALFSLHKVRVQNLAFSPNTVYLVSLGGQDDGCVVLWSLAKKIAICGSPAQPNSAGVTKAVTFANTSDDLFVTAGDNSVRTWQIDLENRKIRPTECLLGQIKRACNCVAISKDDSYFFCGTTSGDVLCIGLKTARLVTVFPRKERFSLGATALAVIKDKAIIVGGGDGSIEEFALLPKTVNEVCVPSFTRTNKRKNVLGRVTSIALRGAGHQFFVASDKCHLYRFNYADFDSVLVNTCHYATVNDIKFPYNCSELFATCSYQDVRVFHRPSKQELLRINIPNMTCYCLDIMRNGTAIISGWDDSKIRAFYPETGRLMFTINDVHKKGVTALAVTSSCKRVVSGGGEGQVRVWQIEEVRPKLARIPYAKGRKKNAQEATYVTKLIATMQEHANAVSCIMITKDDMSCVSSSADGTCIIWCLEKFRRNQIIFANTLFRVACYHPDECQILTSGTDRKIGYWELHDGSLIRELEGSMTGSVNGMDMSLDGELFVSGGDDKVVKVWKYQEGDVVFVGLGHSSPIARMRIAPDQKSIISVGEDGGIFIWELPKVEPAAQQSA